MQGDFLVEQARFGPACQLLRELRRDN